MSKQSKAFASPAHGRMLQAAVPLFSSRAIEDCDTFHKLDFAEPPAFSPEPLFRAPGMSTISSSRRVLTVAKRVTPLEVNFTAPRTAWNHLDEATRRQIAAGAGKNAGAEWHRILLHGSGRSHGDAARLDREHRVLRGLRGGLAYHFVIGNGTDSGDGAVEVGARWRNGAAASAPDAAELGESSISICLVGDFSAAPPTRAQLEALDELVDYLTITTGAVPVAGHRASDGGAATCLGAFFPEEEIAAALHDGGK